MASNWTPPRNVPHYADVTESSPTAQPIPEHYTARMKRLDDLTRHPGWADVVAYAKQLAASALQSAASTESAHKTALLAGAANALTNLIEWPHAEINAVLAAIDANKSSL